MSAVGQWEERLLAILNEARARDHVLYFGSPERKTTEHPPDPLPAARQLPTLPMSGDWKRSHGEE